MPKAELKTTTHRGPMALPEPAAGIVIWTPEGERLEEMRRLAPGLVKKFGKDFDRVLAALDHVAPNAMKNASVAVSILADAADAYRSAGDGEFRALWLITTLKAASEIERNSFR